MSTQTITESAPLVFQPLRIGRSGLITLNAAIDVVYPLFGAIREKDWTYGWEPEILFSASGDMELHMMFRTRSPFRDEYFLWTVTQYRPEEHFVEYLVTADERSWFISVSCEAAGDKTKAAVTYTYTSFTARGHERNQVALKKMFAQNLSDWENALNYYLTTGKQLQ